MDEKRIPLISEDTKYKKKSNAKGLSRSKHKHQYKTVMLSRFSTINVGTITICEDRAPTNVCEICGRVGDIDKDPSYYEKIPNTSHPWTEYSTKFSAKALNLPRWYVEDYFDKFAKEGVSEIIPDRIFW